MHISGLDAHLTNEPRFSYDEHNPFSTRDIIRLPPNQGPEYGVVDDREGEDAPFIITFWEFSDANHYAQVRNQQFPNECQFVGSSHTRYCRICGTCIYEPLLDFEEPI